MRQSVDEVELLLNWGQRFKRRTKLHGRAVPFRPPLRRMNAVAEEEEGETLGGGVIGNRLRREKTGRFQPGESDRGTETLEDYAAGKLRAHRVYLHGRRESFGGIQRLLGHKLAAPLLAELRAADHHFKQHREAIVVLFECRFHII